MLKELRLCNTTGNDDTDERISKWIVIGYQKNWFCESSCGIIRSLLCKTKRITEEKSINSTSIETVYCLEGIAD